MGCGASTSNVVPLVETRDHTAHKDLKSALLGAEPIIGQRTAQWDRDINSEMLPGCDSNVAESPPATPPPEPVADAAEVGDSIGDVLGGTQSIALEGQAARPDSIGACWPVTSYHARHTASPLRVSAGPQSGKFGGSTDLQRIPTRLPPLERYSRASLANLPSLVNAAPANGRRAASEARLSAALAACSSHEDRSMSDLEVRAGRRNRHVDRACKLSNRSAEEEALRAQIFATKLEFIESRRASSSQQDKLHQQQNVATRW
jgi:hypothetical protein